MTRLIQLGISTDDIANAVVAEQITVRRHPTENLFIANYTAQTQYSRNWTHLTRQCRGLIYSGDGTVIARPFPKFFNIGEPEAPATPVGPFIASEKADGSLGVLFREPTSGLLSIATRGSFTSEQAQHATALLRSRYAAFQPLPGVTYLFEILYPANRIVVDYGNLDDLVLLETLSNDSGLPSVLPSTWTGPRASQTRFNSPTELPEHEDNAEGYVLYWPHVNVRLKSKFSDYVRLHRIMTRTNERTVWEALSEDRLEKLLEEVPDEFTGWVDKVAFELKHKYFLVEDAADREFKRIMNLLGWKQAGDRDARKDFAAEVSKSSAHSGVLFRMWDDKPFGDLIWKSVKPVGRTETFRVEAEA